MTQKRRRSVGGLFPMAREKSLMDILKSLLTYLRGTTFAFYRRSIRSDSG
jgi:hypothetical protein